MKKKTLFSIVVGAGAFSSSELLFTPSAAALNRRLMLNGQRQAIFMC